MSDLWQLMNVSTTSRFTANQQRRVYVSMVLKCCWVWQLSSQFLAHIFLVSTSVSLALVWYECSEQATFWVDAIQVSCVCLSFYCTLRIEFLVNQFSLWRLITNRIGKNSTKKLKTRKLWEYNVCTDWVLFIFDWIANCVFVWK